MAPEPVTGPGLVLPAVEPYSSFDTRGSLTMNDQRPSTTSIPLSTRSN